MTAVMCVTLFNTRLALGQVSISGTGVAIVESFDGYQGSALPTNFSSTGNAFPATSGGVYSTSTPYSDSNRYYAFQSSTSATSSAFGIRRASSDSPARLIWNLQNDTGAAVSALAVSWDAVQVASAGRATTLSLTGYSINGGSVSSVGLTSTSFTAATSATGTTFSTLSSQPQFASIALGSALLPGASLQLFWSWGQGAGSGSNAHLGIDNISLSAIPEPSTYGLFLGAGALGLVAYRRHRKKAVSSVAG